MKSLKLCIVAFIAGVGIAALTQNPILETLGYLPDETTEDAVESETDTTETNSRFSSSGRAVRPEEDFESWDNESGTEVASTSDEAVKPNKPVQEKLPAVSEISNDAKKAAKESTSLDGTQESETGSSFEHGVFTHNGFDLPYRLLEPDVADNGKQEYPLLVFLHGAGERGSDNEVQLKHGSKQIQKWLSENEVNAWLLFPQCPTNEQWTDHDWTETKHNMRSTPTKSMGALLGLLDELLEQDSVDKKRVYTIGLSMGGYGVFDLVARRPDVFAAAAPLCGGTDWKPNSIKKLLATPFFIVHGSDDTVVSVQNSCEVVRELKENGSNPIFIELAGVGHDCWTKTFNEDTLFNWLFTKRRTWSKPDTLIAKSNPGATTPSPSKIAKTQVTDRDKTAISKTPSGNQIPKSAEDSKVVDVAAKDTKAAIDEAGNRAPEIQRPKGNKTERVVVAKPPLKEVSPGSDVENEETATATETASKPIESEKAEKKDSKQEMLDGNWYVTRAVHAGRKVSFTKLKTMTMEIDGEQITIVQGDKREVAKIESGEVRKIGETAFAELKITSAGGGKQIRGFYYFDENELTMIWGAPGAERPDPTNAEEMAKARILTLLADQ
jgi:uncharacterized protein (TIGR03067 family)